VDNPYISTDPRMGNRMNDSSSKHLYDFQLNPQPTGHELDSICVYFMRHKPSMISFLYTLYNDDIMATVQFLAGYALAMSMIEDNGYPVDLDDVLHNWVEEEECQQEIDQCSHFDLEGAIREYREKKDI